jgi:hypothetical protein
MNADDRDIAGLQDVSTLKRLMIRKYFSGFIAYENLKSHSEQAETQMKFEVQYS